MNEYPEWLLDAVAKAIDPEAREPESPERHRAFAREQAEAVLDALGFAPWGGSTYWRSNIQWEGAK